ncbi:hypothetical protein BN891_7050 [Bacteroides xylanisolvens SD CC 2a]|nr:hypothetical protein BN891_7050 [Bacteroides xylanisolvens SD CC 2a]
MEDISYRFLPHPSKKISKKNAQTDAVFTVWALLLGFEIIYYTFIINSLLSFFLY